MRKIIIIAAGLFVPTLAWGQTPQNSQQQLMNDWMAFEINQDHVRASMQAAINELTQAKATIDQMAKKIKDLEGEKDNLTKNDQDKDKKIEEQAKEIETLKAPPPKVEPQSEPMVNDNQH